MKKEQFLSLCKDFGQIHLLNHFNNLDSKKQKKFLNQLNGLDFFLSFNLYKKFHDKNKKNLSFKKIKQAPIITIPKTPAEKIIQEKAKKIGENLIKKNKVAVGIVAGGQGSRLGYNGAKGKFPISPIKHKSLFQLFSEYIKAISIKYNAFIPVIIMTSYENDKEIKEFFKSQNYFDLNKNFIYFFQQERIPSITPTGKFILKDELNIYTNPNGHGGFLKGIYKSGILKNLIDAGITDIFYCQIDNPLVKILDPVFLGYHKMEKAEFSLKVIKKRDWQEKLGVYLSIDGKPKVIEYSEIPDEIQKKVDKNGNLVYWAGSIAIHIISLNFIKRLNEKGISLPYHCAVKKVKCFGTNGNFIKKKIWKFETFIFDIIPLAKKVCCMETSREEEFAPVKNKYGKDSPETAKKAITNLYKKWLKEAKVKVSRQAKIEISPLYAIDKEEFIKKIKGKYLIVEKDTYFG